ncbi:heavy metal translocating P-type ATPase [Candidatus Thiothrix sp. Deng01]|uniref:P-type Zn(2+) transporter n=1 Tax=Candidatus Thiothrix phosphatis TaxID=3112415 RepID=A0ABU6D306_9GAMM|nr:heavy metal translocating P-type ATPase [Candidatus Thiothrix sp. Deng01]MEB4592698.1 heavy metal translocating P-type ATPase [Candidatus Thiothrix sp. Deng01]
MPVMFLAAGAVAAGWGMVKVLAKKKKADHPKRLPTSASAVPASVVDVKQDDAASQAIDRGIKQNLALSAGSLALISGSTVAPVLLVPGVGLLTVSLARTLYKVWRQFSDERKVGVTLLDGVAFLMPMLLHMWAMAALTGSFISGAGWMARRTERRSREDLALLFSQQIRTAWVEHDGVMLEVACADLQAGDRVIVDAGMVIPVDGLVVGGVGRVDQQALTGESQPIDKAAGDAVFAATLLLDGKLVIELQKAGSQSMAAELAELLEEVEQSRQDSQTRAQEVIDKWVPTTLGAFILALTTNGVNGALAIVYSSIGYPLRYAGPTSLLNYMHIASRSGVLIRDGRALEKLAKVDLVVFDKTGTLTSAVPTVHRVTAIGSFDALAVLRLAATAERQQSHPLAYAILQAAEASGINAATLDAMKVRPGFGLHVRIDGRDVLVGSERLLTSEGVSIGAYTQDAAPEDIVVYVAVDGELAGFIELAPSIRPEAAAVVKALQATGVEVVVLSGDREAPTRELAETLQLDGYFAEVLPQEKAHFIERLQTSGRSVCFIGDGINDAVALRTADVAVSLKGATSIAESAASILLLDGGLGNLPGLFRLAQSNERTTKRSTTITTVAGVGSMAGVFLLGMGAGPAMALNVLVIGGCMLNATSPLLKKFTAQWQALPPPGKDDVRLGKQPPVLRHYPRRQAQALICSQQPEVLFKECA